MVQGVGFIQKYAVNSDTQKPFAVCGDPFVQQLAAALCSVSSVDPQPLIFDRTENIGPQHLTLAVFQVRQLSFYMQL